MLQSPRILAVAVALALLPGLTYAEDLVQTYQLARTSDPQFAAAESNRRVIAENEVQARAAKLPQLGARGSLDLSRNDGSGSQTTTDPLTGQRTRVDGDSTQTTRTLNIGANGSMVLFDRTMDAQIAAARAMTRAEDFQVEAAGDNLITRTSAAYFNTLTQLETLSAALAAEAALRKQFDYASKRLEVGLAPITDVHEARAQYQNARANTILARTAVDDAYQSLVELTGKPITTLKGLPNNWKPVMPAGGDSEGWVRSALQNNPTLMATQAQIDAADASVEGARAARLPKVTLNGGYGYQRTDGTSKFSGTGFSVSNPIDSSGWGPTVGVAVTVPLWTSGAIESQVRQALARRDVASDQLEAQRRGLVRNTRGAYNRLYAGISEVEARRLALVAAKEAYDASQVGLEVGTRTVLDVLMNQQNLFNAQRAYAQAKYNFLQSRLLLAQAAGTLDIEDVQETNRLLTTTVNAASGIINP